MLMLTLTDYLTLAPRAISSNYLTTVNCDLFVTRVTSTYWVRVTAVDEITQTGWNKPKIVDKLCLRLPTRPDEVYRVHNPAFAMHAWPRITSPINLLSSQPSPNPNPAQLNHISVTNLRSVNCQCLVQYTSILAATSSLRHRCTRSFGSLSAGP